MSYPNDYDHQSGYGQPPYGGGYQQPGYDPYGGYGPPELPHSGMGIASCIIAALVLVGYIATIGFAAVLVAEDPAIAENEESPEMIMTGLGICGTGVLNLVGIVLGFIGMLQSDRKKLFGILGTVGNVLPLVGVLFLMCIGAAAG